MSKVTIDNVIVHKGEPHGGNPFRGTYRGTYPITSVIGGERVNALLRFKHGEDTTGYTFWDLRAASDCEFADGQVVRRITEANKIDWTTSSIE